MSTAELKIELQKLFPEASENALTNALNILNNDHERAEEAKDDELFAKIVAENREVFERLAK